jgi:ketosteroid isomerase-like protein
MHQIIVIFFALVAFCSLLFPASATTDSESAGVRRAAIVFIDAFNNLDWETFTSCFADDATVFFPFASMVRRASGRQEIETSFGNFFAQVRSEGSGPPYMAIQPKDLEVQRLENLAIVTFHLGSDPVARRTVVFHKRQGKWLIVHLHASNMRDQAN